MYKEISKLILYRDLGEDSILHNISNIIHDFETNNGSKDELIKRIYCQVKRILDMATAYGFDKNLWHNYLCFILITNENSFSITCEKTGAHEGSVNSFAKNDFKVFKYLFNYDFSPLEKALNIDCFTTLTNYNAIVKKERMYNKNVSEKVQELSSQIKNAKDENDIFVLVTNFYKSYGVGLFGLNKAFRITGEEGSPDLIPINNMDKVVLDDLVGYEIQKKQLIENTEAFINGKAANNVLLFGDSGTGKSTSIKAIVNQYYSQGLRMIEIYKHQFKDLSAVISKIKNRDYKFIIYMDDLSFEEFEIEYKYLKAVIEGGVETKPDNVLIYATSNRRHLIKETWKNRGDMEHDGEIHRSDSMQEKLSLAHRFGVTIGYFNPTRDEYHEIIKQLTARHPSINIEEEKLIKEADKWAMWHGGISGRTAQQFINYLLGTSN